MENHTKESWICPVCETKNTSPVCMICGTRKEPIPAEEPKKIQQNKIQNTKNTHNSKNNNRNNANKKTHSSRKIAVIVSAAVVLLFLGISGIQYYLTGGGLLGIIFPAHYVDFDEWTDDYLAAEVSSSSTEGTAQTETKAPIVLERIECLSAPTKTTYIVGDKFDPSGMNIIAIYSNGETHDIDPNELFSDVVLSVSGKQDVVKEYEGYSLSVPVQVEEVELTEIRIKQLPSQTTYFAGDSLNTAGLQLEKVYNNGKVETVSEEFTCSPTELSGAGKQEITVSCGSFSTSFSVEVTSVYITGISVKTLPSKTAYFIGDKLDTTGLQLTVTYNNGYSTTITSGFTVDSPKMDSFGTKTVTVSYGGKSAKFDITVKQQEIPTPSEATTNYTLAGKKFVQHSYPYHEKILYEIFPNGIPQTTIEFIDKQTGKLHLITRDSHGNFIGIDEEFFYSIMNGIITICAKDQENGFTTDMEKKLYQFTITIQSDSELIINDTKELTIGYLAYETNIFVLEEEPIMFHLPQVNLITYGKCDSNNRPFFGCIEFLFSHSSEYSPTNTQIFCSWDNHVTGITNIDENIDFVDVSINADTKFQLHHTIGENDSTLTRTNINLYLPDDPKIAGEQTITFFLDGYSIEFILTLNYIDTSTYSDIRGWLITDILYSPYNYDGFIETTIYVENLYSY